MYWLRDLDGCWINLAQAELIDAGVQNRNFVVVATIRGEEYPLWVKELDSLDGKDIEQAATKANIFIEALIEILNKCR